MKLDQTYTHPEDIKIMEELHQIAIALAKEFNLDLKVVEHKRRPHPGGACGLCYQNEGRISVVIRFREGKIWQKGRFKRPCCVDTLIHECAHLPRWENGKKVEGLKDNKVHQDFQEKMLKWLIEQGILCKDTFTLKKANQA